MQLIEKEFKIGRWKISLAAIVWFILALVGIVLKIRLGQDKFANYVIFQNAFDRAIHLKDLYYTDPSLGLDVFLYGPLFTILIAPFAILPINIGAFFWGLANAGFLFFAIRKLPVGYRNQNIILYFAAIEMMTSVQNLQINCIITALIILSFVFVQKQKDIWGTLFIATGFLIKIYGIVGLAFFFFSRHKIKFTTSFIIWLIILFCLPMVITNPQYTLESYSGWYNALAVKNDHNIHKGMISVLSMLQHIFTTPYLNIIITISAAFFYAIPLVRFSQYKNLHFRLSYLALALIGVVIFSSSAESPTYIIAISGVAIWYIIQEKKSPATIALFIFAFLITSFATTDFFPHYLKVNLVKPYSLKALPCLLVLMVLAYQLISKDFNGASLKKSELTPSNIND